MPRLTATVAILFLAGLAQAASGEPDAALRRELEQAAASARTAAESDDYDAFMLRYEPPKGNALVRENWPRARVAAIEELSRPAAGAFLRAVRRGWWAGYFFREVSGGGSRVVMHRFHMGEQGWRVEGISVVRELPDGMSGPETAARVRLELDSYPPFRLPE